MRLIPSPRPRVTRRGTYMPQKYVDQKRLIQSKLRGLKAFSIVPLKIELFIGLKPSKSAKNNKYPMPRGDVDNFSKSILDAMNGILFEDDTQIEELIVKKRYATDNVVFIKIEEIV